MSRAGSLKTDGKFIVGRVPNEISVDEACAVARLTGLNLNLKSEIGALDRDKHVVRVLGLLNSEKDFNGHPQVINGFSDLMVEIFGAAGRGARSAIGIGSLPRGIPVTVEMIVVIE